MKHNLISLRIYNFHFNFIIYSVRKIFLTDNIFINIHYIIPYHISLIILHIGLRPHSATIFSQYLFYDIYFNIPYHISLIISCTSCRPAAALCYDLRYILTTKIHINLTLHIPLYTFFYSTHFIHFYYISSFYSVTTILYFYII